LKADFSFGSVPPPLGMYTSPMEPLHER
jgi:hypothetical protein